MPSTSLVVRGAPLPDSFKGNLNELWQAMLDRISVVSPFGDLQIKIGGIEPTSNIGLWVKDGTKLYVWDEDSKGYVPQDLTDSTAFITGLITTALSSYVTATSLATTLGAYVTTAGLSTALETAITGASGVKFIANQTSPLTTGAMNSSAQTVPVQFNSIVYDPDDGGTLGRYTVKTDGFYHIVFRVHTGVTSGTSDNNSVQGNLYVNAAQVANTIPGVSVFGSYIDECTYVGRLSAGDVISANVQFQTTGGPLTMEIGSNNTSLFVTKI